MVGLVRDMHQMLAKLTMKPIRPPSTATTWHRGSRAEGGREMHQMLSKEGRLDN